MTLDTRRFSTRLVLGVVAALLPLTAILAFVLVRNASDALRDSARAGLATAARTTASRTDGWYAERRSELRLLADDLRSVSAEDLRKVVTVERPGFEELQLLRRDGRVVAGDASREPITGPGSPAFAAAVGGEEGATQPAIEDGTIRTLLTEPVRDRAGRVTGVLVGDLDESVLTRFLAEVQFGDTGEANIRTTERLELWNSALGVAPDPPAMVRAGALRNRAETEAVRRAVSGENGATGFVDNRGVEVVGGFALVRLPEWTTVVKQSQDEAYAATDEQRDLAIIIAVLGILAVILAAMVFARRTTRPLKDLVAAAGKVAGGDLRVRAEPSGPVELRDLGASFNAMVEGLEHLALQIRGAGTELAASSAELSSAAHELATTTNEQTAATTQTSSTMEELAQTSQRIAESVEDVAERTRQTQGVLARADEDLQASSERTMALAERAVEIGQIVTLINGIADRTNLLALNAAIEAARAGEAGAGFAVVAEEVRLLAERSKAEAAKIGEIVSRAQTETNATVMSMETGSKEMRHGLELMDAVTDATSEVHFSTEQQRIATDQVVQTMVSVSGATKQTAATAQQVATSSAQIAALAARLNDTVAVFRTASGTDRAATGDDGPAAPPPDGAAE